MKTPAKGTASRPDLGSALTPKPRAAGGIWLTQSDFPFAFQNIIVYHNINKYSHSTVHQDIWENSTEPYICNDKEVYIKLELDEESIEKVKQQEKLNKNIGVLGNLSQDQSQEQLEAEESKDVDDAANPIASIRSTERIPLPGELDKEVPHHDNIIIACAPYPTNKMQKVLPRYNTRLR
mmetsp:Transcript_4779/g.7210  ORF Transcript_4779/g.7210 Transcript_4779/m.7210 type:complete len:179 (+) Transcript_4779:646-1182(+)